MILWGLLLAFAAILFIIGKLKKPVAWAMAAGIFILSWFLPLSAEETLTVILQAAVCPATIKLAAIVLLITVLGQIMKDTGLLKQLIEAMLSLMRNYKLLVAAIPLIIGMLPIPGGAILSAPLIAPTKKMGFSNEILATANVFYRHLTLMVFPFVPTIILIQELVGLPVFEIIKFHFLPVLVAFILSFPIIFRNFHPQPLASSKDAGPASKSFYRLFIAFSPIILALVLALGLNLEFWVALAAGCLLTLLLGSGRQWSRFCQVARTSILPGINVPLVAAIFMIMIFKNLVEAGGVVEELSYLVIESNVPIIILIILLSMVMGYVSGHPIAAAGVLYPVFFPLLIGIEGGTAYLPFIYTSIIFGYVISPVHLCLIVTLEYFQVDLKDILLPLAVCQAILLAAAYGVALAAGGLI